MRNLLWRMSSVEVMTKLNRFQALLFLGSLTTSSRQKLYAWKPSPFK